MTPSEIQQAASTALQLVNQKIALQNLHGVLSVLATEVGALAELKQRTTVLRDEIAALERLKARAEEEARASQADAAAAVSRELNELREKIKAAQERLTELADEKAVLARERLQEEQRLASVRGAIARVTEAAG